MDRAELNQLGNDLYHTAARLADQVSDQVASRGRHVMDRGYSAFRRMRASDPAPLVDLRGVVRVGVGAAALIGVGLLIRRIARERSAQKHLGGSAARTDGLNGGTSSDRVGERSNEVRAEPTYKLLARLDSPEAIQRHNEEVRREHESAHPETPRQGDQETRQLKR